MEINFVKLFRLFGSILFLFLGIILGIVLLLVALRFLMSGLNYIPWLTYAYMSIMLLVPATLFLTVFGIFSIRTKAHPSKPIRLFSFVVFFAAIVGWLFILIKDFIFFFKEGYGDINKYDSFNLLYLVISVGVIFLMGVVQALAMPAEKDWLEKRQSRNQ